METVGQPAICPSGAGHGRHNLAGSLAAVLFDMDGTLVDSEKVWDIGLDGLAARYGARLSAPARLRMLGTSMAESIGILHDDIGQPWRDPQDSVGWLEARVNEIYSEGLVWRPGARELLDAVRAAGLPRALVTTTRRSLVRTALATTIGADNFDVIVCGDDGGPTKPDPYPYRSAARKLGVDVLRCVAIEDSPTGIASARAAGAAVLAVPCAVAIPASDGVTVVDSLAGIDVNYLHRMLVEPPARRPVA